MVNNKLRNSFIALSLSCVATNHVIAAPALDTNMQEMVEKIVNKRTEALQKEVGSLQQQLNHLNAQQGKTNTNNKPVTRIQNAPENNRSTRLAQNEISDEGNNETEVRAQIPAGNNNQTPLGRAIAETTPSAIRAPTVEEQEDNSGMQRTAVQAETEGSIEPLGQRSLSKNYALNALFLGGYPVFTSPYIGIFSSYDGSDLIINQSTINLDVRLLRQTQALDKFLQKNHVPEPEHPVIEVSGRVEAQAFAGKINPGTSRADIDVNAAEFDVFAQLNKWALGFISMQYDNNPFLAYRASNSNLVVPRAFVTLGNFDYSPIYMSIGQMRPPFGQFNSNFLSSLLTQRLGRLTERAITLGWRPMDEKGFYAAAFAFRGDTTASRHRNGGVNVGYEYSDGKFSMNAAAAVISNLAESERMQLTGAPASIPFQGFGITSATEVLYHNVPAFDARGTINYDKYSLITEWVSAARGFDPANMTFNGQGAKPAALHVEGAYRFELDKKPGVFALGYDWSRQSLALILPRHRYMGVISYSFVRNTILSLEYRRDVHYKGTDTATGAGSAPFGPIGTTSDLVTAQLGVYF